MTHEAGRGTMMISERSRHVMYTRFGEFLDDEEAVQEMLSVYPATELDEPASRAFIEAQTTELRIEMAGIRSSMGEMEARLVERIHAEVNGSRTELREEIDGLRTELKGEIAGVRKEVRTLTHWAIGMVVTLIGMVVALAGALVASQILTG